MTTPELAEAYLGALGDADLTAMLSLFSEDAVVHSPLYGPVPAAKFFPALFSDTAVPLRLAVAERATCPL
jgi:ketosteroid isomerase-like protein